MDALMDPRHIMWIGLIKGYKAMSKWQRKAAQLVYAADRGLHPYQIEPGMEYPIVPKELQMNTEAEMFYQPKKTFLDCCQNIPQTCGSATISPLCIKDLVIQEYLDWGMKKQEEKDKNMYSNINVTANTMPVETLEQARIDYLVGRLADAFATKKFEARKVFFLDEVPPTSPKQLVEWIKAGKFEFNKRRTDKTGEWLEPSYGEYTSSFSQIDWREKPADQTGYDAWRTRVNLERQKVEDIIKVMPATEGLAALQAFEAAEIK